MLIKQIDRHFEILNFAKAATFETDKPEQYLSIVSRAARVIIQLLYASQLETHVCPLTEHSLKLSRSSRICIFVKSLSARGQHSLRCEKASLVAASSFRRRQCTSSGLLRQHPTVRSTMPPSQQKDLYEVRICLRHTHLVKQSLALA